MNGRRWFLKALVAAPFVPLAAKVAAAVELAPMESAAGQAALAARFPVCAGIIADTIEGRSRTMADNVHANNALLRSLKLHSHRMKTEPEYRRTVRLKEWRQSARYKYSSSLRGHPPVRVDSRCPSGYAAWAESVF